MELADRLLEILRGEETVAPAKEVIDIFESCFGEEHIDIVKPSTTVSNDILLRNNYDSMLIEDALDRLCHNFGGYRQIIIKFDHEVVTNELGMSTDLYDFFVKVCIGRKGELVGYPEYKKATFTENQLFSQYIHSHTPRLYLSTDGIKQWGNVCLGTGPIRDTISRLWSAPSNGLWMGFIAELRQIIRHESLEGGPYIRMEYIKGPSKEVKFCAMVDQLTYKRWIPLMKSYIRAGRLPLGVINKEFCLGVPFTEFLIDFTEYAKVWARTNNIHLTLKDTMIQNNKIYDSDVADQYQLNTINRLLGQPVITFRGTVYPLRQIKSTSNTTRRLFPYNIAATLVRKSLNVLNYWFNEDSRNQENPTAPVYK